MLNRILIIGNLGRDPELRYMDDGRAVCSFSVAATRVNKSKEKETTWFRVSVFDKQAESCNQYLTKGRQVYIDGRLTSDAETGGPRVYQRQDGTWAASYDVIASDVRFLGSKPDVEPESKPAKEVKTEDMPF